VTAEPSVRDRAARIIAIASNELWGHDGPPDPSDIEEGEHVADVLAAAGLLAGARQVALNDIDDQHVVDLARAWQHDNDQPGVVAALVSEGMDEGLAVDKVEDLAERDLLEYGTSPYYAWPIS